MPKTILPKELREKIINYFQQGYSSLEVFDSILEKAAPYVKSESQLSRCIASLKGRAVLAEKREKKKKRAVITPPKRKPFDVSKYKDIINGLREHMSGLEFEKLCSPIVIDILTNLEGFKNIKDANEGEGFHNPPFDYLGFKKGRPYIIEFKGSLSSFNTPGETQKRRMQELLKKIKDLNIALLQLNLRAAQYRIFYNEQMDLLFDGHQAPIEPIVKWIS